jgi:hypothetical protein
MYSPYTAHDLIRVMEQDIEERRSARARRARAMHDVELRRSKAESARSRFATLLLRATRLSLS